MNTCLTCGNTIDNNKKFCNNSCSAIYNNKLRKKKVKYCKHCGKDIPLKNKFCDGKCQKEYQYVNKVKQYLNGEISTLGSTIKRYLKERDGDKCSECGITEWNDKPIVLEIEHIDGNSENNKENNLKLLCPNCHSQTPTYKGANKGNGRHTRRQRYKENKSY